MDIVTLAQVVTSVTNLLFVVVLAGGYYFTWRVSQTTLEEMRAQRTVIGRPLVIVQEDYESLPDSHVARGWRSENLTGTIRGRSRKRASVLRPSEAGLPLYGVLRSS
jgi:hypothetical protein